MELLKINAIRKQSNTIKLMNYLDSCLLNLNMYYIDDEDKEYLEKTKKNKLLH
jgi:hypothetical protein